jgi:hypothetical protein
MLAALLLGVILYSREADEYAALLAVVAGNIGDLLKTEIGHRVVIDFSIGEQSRGDTPAQNAPLVEQGRTSAW